MNGFKVLFATCEKCQGTILVSSDPQLAAHTAFHDSGECLRRYDAVEYRAPETTYEGPDGKQLEFAFLVPGASAQGRGA